MTRIFTSVCSKHPELNGERHAHNHSCVGCRREANIRRAKERYHSDPEYRAKVVRMVVEHGKANVEQRRARANRSYAKNRDIYAPKKAARGRVRKHHMTQAQPPWMATTELVPFYAEAKRLGLSVDHIVPLVHPLVCGLHVPWNLRLMPLSENVAKGNQFDVS